MPRLLQEADPGGPHPLVITCEVLRVQEETDPAARLRPDARELGLVLGAREQQPRARGATRPHDDPAGAVAPVRVLHRLESEGAGVEGEGLVVVADDQRDQGDVSMGTSSSTYGCMQLYVTLTRPRPVRGQCPPWTRSTSPHWRTAPGASPPGATAASSASRVRPGPASPRWPPGSSNGSKAARSSFRWTASTWPGPSWTGSAGPTARAPPTPSTPPATPPCCAGCAAPRPGPGRTRRPSTGRWRSRSPGACASRWTSRSWSPRATTCCWTTGPGRRCGRCWTRCGSSTPIRSCGCAGWSTGTCASGSRAPHAERWVAGSDERNARLVERHRDRADLVVRVR